MSNALCAELEVGLVNETDGCDARRRRRTGTYSLPGTTSPANRRVRRMANSTSAAARQQHFPVRLTRRRLAVRGRRSGADQLALTPTSGEHCRAIFVIHLQR